MRFGAIEAGGTKFVCGVGNSDGILEDRVQFPTERPEVTLAKVTEYFADKEIQAIGIGSFGPLELDASSPEYGHLTTTPKPGWSGYPLLPHLKRAFHVPFGLDTDVNAAAYGEAKWGAAQRLDSCIYITIGTGVGIGIYAEGRLVHGLVHPEGGHLFVRRHPEDGFPGTCPFHGDCLEGMASGPALEKRWGLPGGALPGDHPAWRMQAYYIGQAVADAILLLSPKKVILGGGVMKQDQLLQMIREEVQRRLNGYVNAKAILEDIDQYVTAPGLGEDAGLLGALALGIDSWKDC